MDVVEIGTAQCNQGGVYKVKVLGAYAMIDDGELDWKMICIRVDDPKAANINDIEDVERYGACGAVRRASALQTWLSSSGSVL